MFPMQSQHTMDRTEKSSLMKTVSKPESMDQEFSLIMDLFDKEPDIIANIFCHLNFRDRLSLAATCTELNSLLNNQSELWKSVWFDAGKASSATSNLLRKYSNVSVKFNEKTAGSLKDILTPLAPAINALDLYYYGKSSQDSKFIDIIVDILRMVAQKLESLDLRVELEYNFLFNLPVNVNKVIALSNLKHLNMEYNMFAAIQRHLDFSQCKSLRSIHIGDGGQFRFGGADDISANLALVDLITQQSAPKILMFNCGAWLWLFDHPLLLECQLDELYILPDSVNRRYEGSTAQLENMLDLIDSQQQLKKLRVNVKSRDDITPRMFGFNARLLDAPLDKLKISNSDWKEIKNESCSLPTCELLRIFSSQHIEPNEITTDVCLRFTSVDHQDWLMPGLVRKYPNMKIFTIGPSYGPLPNLAPLNNSINLRVLNIRVRRRLCSPWRDVNISGLKVFDLFVYKGLMLNRDFVQMKNFLARHKKLTALILHIDPEESDKKNLDEIQRMIESSFDLIHFAIKNLPELAKLSVDTGLDMRNHPKWQTMVSSHDEFTFRLLGYELKAVRT